MWAFQLLIEDLNTDESGGDDESASGSQPTPMADDSDTTGDLQGWDCIDNVLFLSAAH